MKTSQKLLYLFRGLAIPAPVAAFAYTHDAAGSRQVAFTDQSTNTPTAWDWDWGDGTAHGTTQNPTHTYANDGTYTVTLIATNAGGSSAPVAQIISVVGYLLQDEFTTAQGAPLTSPRACEPLGTLTLVQTDGQFSIAGGEFLFPAQASGVWGDQRYYSASFARLTGRALGLAVRMTTGANRFFGLAQNNSGSVASAYESFYSAATSLNVENAGGAFVAIIVVGTNYEYRIVLTSDGALYFIKGGVFTQWTFLWKSVGKTLTPLFDYLTNFDSAGAIAYNRVRTQLPAPFQTDEGIASVNVTAFTQSLGAELLVNGGFANWTADNPDGWTVTGEVGADPMVTQVAPGGGAGTGAARLFASGATSSPVLVQGVLTVGSLCEWVINLSAYTSGIAVFNNNDAGGVEIQLSGVGVKQALGRVPSSGGVRLRATVAAHDFVIDSASVKQVTPNAVHTATADAITDLTFTLPASPIAGQRIEMRYRVNGSTPTLDYWVLIFERNGANTSWNFEHSSVASGAATPRNSVTGIAATGTITLRAIYEGSLHDAYTLISGTWTKRGAQINLSHQNTSTGVQAVYSSAATPVSLKSYPRTAAAYAELDRVRS